MQNILVVAPYVSLPGEPTFNRFLYLCYQWAKAYNVTLVTSSFCHFTKQQRDRNSPQLANLPFELVLIDEPGYRKNVSPARILSHRAFHRAFKIWFRRQFIGSAELGLKPGMKGARSPYDVVFSAFPLISTNLTIGKLKRQFNYKFVIDVQDIWPDSIFAVLPVLKKVDFLLAPLRNKAHKAYSYADGLVAVSETYLQVARRLCPQTAGFVTYLGSDYQLIESIAPQPLPADKVRLVYLGTLSRSYDLATVIQGFNQLSADFGAAELHILGDGPERERLEAIAGDRVFFHGYLPYEEMVAFVKACDFFVNSIARSATQSITNKLSDYMALGLPILSSQQNPEAKALIQKRGGYFFEPGSSESFTQAAAQALSARTPALTAASTSGTALGRSDSAVRRVPDSIDFLFDRRIAYPKMTEFVEKICAT